MRRAATVLFAMGAAACSPPSIGDGGGGSGGGPGQGASDADAAPLPDPVDDLPGGADAGVVEDDGCYSTAIGQLELVDPSGFTDGTGTDAYFGLTAAIDGVPVGVFYIDLYGGIGSLRNGPLPGIYPIEGEDTDWSLCAACVWASFGVSEEIWVMAQGGTLRLDEVGARLIGSVSDIELVEIDDQDVPVPGGCTATIASKSFDVLVE
jgi:hypothetical protein